MRTRLWRGRVPLYEYECRKCHHRFERLQDHSDPLVKKCPRGRVGGVRKLISSPAVHFKGSGWYITDYARKGKTPGAGNGEKGSGNGDAGKAAAGDSSSGDSPPGKKSPEKPSGSGGEPGKKGGK